MKAPSALTLARRMVEFLRFCTAHPEPYKQQMPCGCIYRFYVRAGIDGEKVKLYSVERCTFHA